MALATSVTYLKKGGWASDKIRVVTTILPLADFVRQVGKDMVDVTTMVAPGDSPHALQFAPSKLEMLSQADMYIKVGSNVDFELALMDEFIALNSTMHVVDCSQSVELLVADGDDHDNNDHGSRQLPYRRASVAATQAAQARAGRCRAAEWDGGFRWK